MTEDQHPDLARLLGPDRRAVGLGVVPAVLGALVLLGLVLLRPTGQLPTDLSGFGITGQVYRARVTEVLPGPCSYAADLSCTEVVFTLLEGPIPGVTTATEFEMLPGAPTFERGEAVVLSYHPDAPPELQYQFADRDRRWVLAAVAIFFALAVVGLGRLRGLTALAGLVASVVMLVWFIVPSILQGRDPVIVATVGASAIALLALYLAHGFNPMTHVAVIGTFSALVLIALLSAATVEAARFSGLAGEEGGLLVLAGDVDVRGLVLAGITLGALGALDDVTVTQASAVWEIRRADPSLPPGGLFAAGLRVGRDHIASTVNTLLLAYAGASMPLLLLFALSDQPLGIVANSEVVAVEIVRTLVGSVGLVAAVPVTTWLAARVATPLPADA